MKKWIGLLMLLGASPAFAGVAFTRNVLDVIRTQQYEVQQTVNSTAYMCNCAVAACNQPLDVLLVCEGAASPLTEPEATALNYIQRYDNACSACACNNGAVSITSITVYAVCLLYP